MDVDPSALATRLERLPPEAFEAFVVDLFRARGWSVERSGGHLRATDRVGTEYAVHLHRVDASPADVDDILVTTDPGRPPTDVRVVGPDEIHRLLRYAVDRRTARALYRRTFGRPPDGPASRWPALPLDRRTVVVVLAAVAGLSLASLGGAFLETTPGDGGVTTPGVTTPGVSPTATAGNADVATLPPGVDRDGDVDATRLARVHREAVADRSYRLVVSYREFGGDVPAGRARERIVVESANVYATDLSRIGHLVHGGDLIADVEAYAEGGIRYQRVVSGDEPGLGTRAIGQPAVATRYAARIEAYLRRYLSVERSRIVATFQRDDRTHYWLALRGDDASNVTVGVVVDERGVVHSLRRSAEIPGTANRSAVVSIRYAEFGDVCVSPPAWYERARNRSSTRRADLAGVGRPPAHSRSAAP